MENYSNVLMAKLPIIVLVMIMSWFLPRNNDINNLAILLRQEHIKKRDRISQKLKFGESIGTAKEGGDMSNNNHEESQTNQNTSFNDENYYQGGLLEEQDGLLAKK